MTAADILQPLIEICPARHFKKGMLLIQEGDSAGSLYILLSGRLRAFSYSADGKEITYGLYTPVDLVGEMCLDGGERSASVIAHESCECAVLSVHVLKAQMALSPELSFWVIERVIARARAATVAARNMALLDVYGRLKAFLESQISLSNRLGAAPVGLRFTHQELAHRIGSSREMVSKLMKDLEEGGYINIVDRSIQIRNTLPDKW
jgi:CRP/FNR family transcriptional regulator, cyclic AMP receptor protein